MFRKTDYSVLEPFLNLEERQWGQVLQFTDDILTMVFAPEAFQCFRSLLKHLERWPGHPLVFLATEKCFSPERCAAFLKQLGDLSSSTTASNFFPTLCSAVAMARGENAFGGMIRWLRSAKRPTTMVLRGDVCLSFLRIGLACDYRIATSDTTFYNVGRSFDMPPGTGLLHLLPAYIGLGRTYSLVTKSTEISAYSALKWGLLNEVIAPSELDETLRTMAAEISCFSPETLDTIKQLLNHHLPDLENFFAAETQGLDRALRGKPWEKLPNQSSSDTSL